MADKVRIYQLARELNVESKVLMAQLAEMGIDAKSASSTIEAEVAETVKTLLEAMIGDSSHAGNNATGAAGEPTAALPPLRAPVVTVMGHVDHGKTSLLDFIRKTKVAEREAGGITQHIGAYQAQTPSGLVTFLDTPGHAAFTAIRQRGANATDIAVIVVAADDSIMPQTREAVAHAKAARVPIVVAINKIDLPQANPNKVLQDLMQLDLIPEAFGGDVITVPLSALTGKGVDDLLEMLSLVAEIEELRADPKAPTRGVVIESVLDKRAGVLATVLVQEGTLRVGDILVCGEVWGKVRRLTDYTGAIITEAGPSVPVQVLGFSELPAAGETIEGIRDDATAKVITQSRINNRQDFERESIGRKGLTLADLFGKPTVKTIHLLLRADTQGSLEAIKGVIAQAAAAVTEVDIDLMLAEVGSPTESDLLLASTANASLLAFGVTAPASVLKAAERQKIPIKSYRIIYDLIEEVERMIKGQIEPTFEERILGHAEVRMVIKVPRSGNIAGSYVTDGTLRRGAKARLRREGREVYKGSIAQLRRFKDDVREVSAGFECGINLQNYDNVQEGDIIEIYEMVEVPAT